MATRRDAQRALERARATPATRSQPSGQSKPAREGDVLAIYAAPREPLGVEAQAALGAGSVSSEIVGADRSGNVDRAALAREVERLEPGVYSVLVAFDVEGAPGEVSRYIQRERRDVVIGSEERAAIVGRAIQSAARDVVKGNSARRVRVVEAVLVPEDQVQGLGVEIGQDSEIPLDLAPPEGVTLTRSDRAKRQPRDARGKFIRRRPPRAVLGLGEPVERPRQRKDPKRVLAGKLSAVARRARAEGKDVARAKAGYLGALKANAKRKRKR